MELSIKTCENARFEIEKDTPKDNIVSSILSYIDKLKDPQNETRETIKTSALSPSLLDTLSYNIKLDTGKEINLKETIKEDIRLNLSSISYEDRLKEASKNAKDLLDIKDKDERRNLVLNSTPYQLSDMICTPDRHENPIKTEMRMMIDESKYDSKDAFHAPEIAGYAIRSMSLNEVSQLFDCKDVFSLGKYEKICFFPASNVYEDRSKELFGDGDDKLTIKFEIRSNEIYDHLSVGEYNVSNYEWGSELRQEPCLDILKEEKGLARTVLSPEYHLSHYNIGELVPVEINGKDISCMTVSDISEYIRNIPSYDYYGYDDMDMSMDIDKDIDKGVLGTGDVLKDMAFKLEPDLKDDDLKNEKSKLIQTIEKNMSANIGREIDIEKQIKTKEYSQINREKEKTDFSERLEKAKVESKDLLDIKDREERQKTVLNSTVTELSQRINPISKTENTNEIKEDLKNKYELSKKEDSKIERDPVKHVYRTMNAAELKQLFDGRDVVNVAEYEKLHFFPDTLDYESRANSLFGIRSDEYDWDVKDKIGVVFEVRDDDFYNNISGAYYTVSDESSFDSVKMDPHFDIKLQDMYGSVDVITPEYQVMSYNIGQLMPISIDGKDITDMKIQDILNDLKGNTYSPIDVEDKYVGTGLSIEHLEKMPSMGEAYINWCNEQGIEPEFY